MAVPNIQSFFKPLLDIQDDKRLNHSPEGIDHEC